MIGRFIRRSQYSSLIGPGPECGGYGEDALCVIQTTLADPCPDIKKLAAELVMTLATRAENRKMLRLRGQKIIINSTIKYCYSPVLWCRRLPRHPAGSQHQPPPGRCPGSHRGRGRQARPRHSGRLLRGHGDLYLVILVIHFMYRILYERVYAQASHMAQRVFDPSPAVRRRHVEVLGAWCLAMPDRCWHLTERGASH